MVELCDLSGNHHSLKSPFIINSQSLKRIQKDRSYFSQATHIWERYECPKQSFISTISVSKIYTKAVVPDSFVTADRSMLDNFTAGREYSCNSVSVGRFGQSHAQKASGVTTSVHFVNLLKFTGRSRRLKATAVSMLRASVWRCFGYPHIGKKQCLKRIANCSEVQ